MKVLREPFIQIVRASKAIFPHARFTRTLSSFIASAVPPYTINPTDVTEYNAYI